MSFGEEWVLPCGVETYSDEDLVAKVRGLLPAGTVVALLGENDARAVCVTFPASDVESIAAKLASREGQLDWEWRRDMDPPRDGETYTVQIDIVDDQGPLVRVHSSDESNREAWPIAFSIASSLAEILGATSSDDAPISDAFPMFIEPGRTSKPN